MQHLKKCVKVIILKYFSYDYSLRSHKITTLVVNNVSQQM